MPLIMNSHWGTHTHTHIHTQIRTHAHTQMSQIKAISRNQGSTGSTGRRLAHAWFQKEQPKTIQQLAEKKLKLKLVVQAYYL